MELESLDYLVLIVRELDPAVRFYSEVLGLELQHRSGNYAQLRAGTTRLGLYTRGAMEETLGQRLLAASPDAPAFELGFKVPDVDAAFEELVRLGVRPVASPTTRPRGQRTAYVRDPDGNLVELAQDLPSLND